MLINIMSLLFLFRHSSTTEIYTLSLHDALPISAPRPSPGRATGTPCCAQERTWRESPPRRWRDPLGRGRPMSGTRSEEHTSELQSLAYLVCRLLLEKKKKSSDTHRKCRARYTLV